MAFGFLFIAGYTATNKLYGILEVVAISFGYAITTFVSQTMELKISKNELFFKQIFYLFLFPLLL